MKAINRTGRNIKKIINNILLKLDPSGQHPIHLSIDVDALDPTYIPSTGTPVKDGLTLAEGKQVIKEFKATGRLVSLDLSEVNPDLGTGKDARTTLDSTRQLINAYYE